MDRTIKHSKSVIQILLRLIFLGIQNVKITFEKDVIMRKIAVFYKCILTLSANIIPNFTNIVLIRFLMHKYTNDICEME